MTKYFIKVDSEKNAITHPEAESSLILALGDNFNSSGNYIEFREPKVPELTELIYPVEKDTNPPPLKSLAEYSYSHL